VEMSPIGGQIAGLPASIIENSACPDGSYSSSLDSVLDPTGIEYCMPWWVGGWAGGWVLAALLGGLYCPGASAHQSVDAFPSTCAQLAPPRSSPPLPHPAHCRPAALVQPRWPLLLWQRQDCMQRRQLQPLPGHGKQHRMHPLHC
jgi:hypothetical protein